MTCQLRTKSFAAAIGIAFLVIAPVISFGAQETADATAQDMEVLESVRKQVEALPKDKQIVVGAELVRSALARMKTKPMRQRVMVSLGDLYAEQGVLDESVQFYTQAIEVAQSTELATYSRLRVASVLRRSGKNEEADRFVNELQAVRVQSRDGKASLDENVVSVKVDAMISAAQFDEAVAYCRELSREFPASRNALLYYAERVPNALMKDHKQEEAIEFYSRIRKDFEGAKTNALFNRNYISALRYCDPACSESQLERLRIAIDEFGQSFPNDPNAALFFATYADSLHHQGRDEQAKQYYKKAIEHPKVPVEVKQAILRMLDTIETDELRRAGKTSVKPGLVGTRRLLLLVNGVVIVVFVAWLAYRKRRVQT